MEKYFDEKGCRKDIRCVNTFFYLLCKVIFIQSYQYMRAQIKSSNDKERIECEFNLLYMRTFMSK